MSSSPTTRNRLNKQGTGDNANTWGEKLNSEVFDLIDTSLDGITSLTVTADDTLTSTNYAADEARSRTLKIAAASTASATITLPAVEKWYVVWNASSYDQTIASAGGGTSVTVKAGEVIPVVTDGTNVARLTLLTMGSAKLRAVADPTDDQDACTKAYADALAFTANAGVLPGQTGNSGKVLTTDGTTASWTGTLTDFTLATPTITTPTVTGGGFSSPTITTPTVTGGATFSGAHAQNVQAISAEDIDWSDAEYQTKSISANTTFTFSGITASKGQALLLLLTISSSAVPTWPAAVVWSSGTTPTLGDGTHLLGFVTHDGGTTVVAVLAGYNVS